jgi:hypothetical protein
MVNIRSQRELPDAFIKVLAKKMKVPKPTIASWHDHLLRDSSSPPDLVLGRTDVLLTGQEETEVVETVQRDFIDRQKDCPPLLIS